MIPETIGAVFGLLLIIGPGLVFHNVREHYRPTAERSALHEGASIALASLIFTAGVAGVLALGRLRWPDLIADPRLLLVEGKQYVAAELPLVSASILTLVLMSTGLAAIAALAWFRRSGGGNIHPNSTGWYELFRNHAPKNANSMLRVRLADGTEYRGLLAFYSANILPAERELALGPPLFIKRPGEGDFSPLPDGGAWRRVLISGASIDALWVRYAPLHPPADA